MLSARLVANNTQNYEWGNQTLLSSAEYLIYIYIFTTVSRLFSAGAGCLLSGSNVDCSFINLWLKGLAQRKS
jgi:hypothetical protein